MIKFTLRKRGNMIIIRKELEKLLDNAEAEQKSYTPDFILAQFLFSCLSAYDEAVNSRDKWYGTQNDIKEKKNICFNSKEKT